jgi:hypothetical protein
MPSVDSLAISINCRVRDAETPRVSAMSYGVAKRPRSLIGCRIVPKLYAVLFSTPPRKRVPHFSRVLCARGGRQCSRQQNGKGTPSTASKNPTTCHPERSIRIREANSDAESKDPFHLSISNRPGKGFSHHQPTSRCEDTTSKTACRAPPRQTTLADTNNPPPTRPPFAPDVA